MDDNNGNAHQIKELLVLYNVAQAGTEARSLDQLIEQSLLLLADTFPTQKDFGIGLIDWKAGIVNGYTCLKGRQEKRVFPLDEGIAGRVIKTGIAERVDDITNDPDYFALFPGLKSELCVPIKTSESVLGVILAESHLIAAFTNADEQLMSTFAGQLATSIVKVRLQQEAQRAAERWSVFSNATKEISASLQVEEVFLAIQNAASKLMPWDSFLISLLDDTLTQLEDVYLFEDDRRFPPARYPADEGLSAHVISNGKSLHIDDFNDQKPEIEPIIVGVLHTRSIIIVPMIVKSQVIGTLSVQSTAPNAYSSEDRELIESLASHAASAVENAKLYAEVQRLAVTDPLTNLFNRRQFFNLALQEFKRIKRFHHPLSAIMLDIDHFKGINDTCGHAFGDQVLRELARVCNMIVRSTDIFARIGGEEFVILLIETSPHGAIQIAERLRQELASTQISYNEIHYSITASIGVAHVGDDCESIEHLLECADNALYAAKRAGRNCVKVYSPVC